MVQIFQSFLKLGENSNIHSKLLDLYYIPKRNLSGQQAIRFAPFSKIKIWRKEF